jgi:hypothetical protein
MKISKACVEVIVKKSILFASCCFLMLLSFGCSASRTFVVPEPLPSDQRLIPEPQEKEINIIGDNVDKLFTRQVGVLFDFSQHIRKISGRPKQAYNVDAFGRVPNSSWFTNRNGLQRMTLEEIARGPNRGDGPDTSGTWEIIRAKAEGVTPGFTIQDVHGEQYVIKFDPQGYSELATGAEVVSTKLIYAAGYNTPENYLVYFHPRILKMGQEVKLTDKKGQKRFMTEDDLQELLERIEYLPDGRIRAVASKYLAGKLKGPFRYEGTVDDDPNDYIPHQHRRELRGLRVIAAWLNHFDTKANNSLDVYVEEGYMRHYLIDFGSTLGSQGDEPMPAYIGFEGSFDLVQIFKQIATLGFYIRPWEKEEPIRYTSIGRFHNRDFKPQKYKFILPNPAFQRLTNLDGYWGAKIVMSFTDDQIETAVAQGVYSDPRAREYLLRTLIERRDIIGRYYFSRVNPLDNFELEKNVDGMWELRFDDLAVKAGWSSPQEIQYLFRITSLPEDKEVAEFRTTGNLSRIPLRDYSKARSGGEDGYSEVTIQVKRKHQDIWGKWVKIYLEREETTGGFRLLAVVRQN